MRQEIVENILAYIASKGITEAEFERICHLGKASVFSWKHGKQTPTLTTLGKIATYTKIPVETWLTKGAIECKQEPAFAGTSKQK